VINDSLESYMKHIVSMFNDPSSIVVWRIIQGVVTIVDMEVDLILKPENYNLVADLMITAMRNPDQRISLSACEFWSALICSAPDDESLKISLLRGKLENLLPVMMEGCLMTEQDQMSMIASKDEDAFADRKPKGISKESEEPEEEDGEEENYEVDLNENAYTLRKASAFTISRFSSKCIRPSHIHRGFQ
jgi:transportin-1